MSAVERTSQHCLNNNNDDNSSAVIEPDESQAENAAETTNLTEENMNVVGETWSSQVQDRCSSHWMDVSSSPPPHPPSSAPISSPTTSEVTAAVIPTTDGISPTVLLENLLPEDSEQPTSNEHAICPEPSPSTSQDTRKYDDSTEPPLPEQPSQNDQELVADGVLDDLQLTRLQQLLSMRIFVDAVDETLPLPRLSFILGDFLNCIRCLLADNSSLDFKGLSLNGGAASFVMAASRRKHIKFNDIDIIVNVSLGDDYTIWDEIKTCVAISLIRCGLNVGPDIARLGLENRPDYISIMKRDYMIKSLLIRNPPDLWSLTSLQNHHGLNLELKFVDHMRRQFQFTVDSFQIALEKHLLDSTPMMITENHDGIQQQIDRPPATHVEPKSVRVVSAYGNFDEALWHLHRSKIFTIQPELLRGGGLLKYCELLSRHYKPLNEKKMRALEPYMCTRFFIDFSDVAQQEKRLVDYVKIHYKFNEGAEVHKFLFNFREVVRRSCGCLMQHERYSTMAIPAMLSGQILYHQQQNYARACLQSQYMQWLSANCYHAATIVSTIPTVYPIPIFVVNQVHQLTPAAFSSSSSSSSCSLLEASSPSISATPTYQIPCTSIQYVDSTAFNNTIPLAENIQVFQYSCHGSQIGGAIASAASNSGNIEDAEVIEELVHVACADKVTTATVDDKTNQCGTEAEHNEPADAVLSPRLDDIDTETTSTSANPTADIHAGRNSSKCFNDMDTETTSTSANPTADIHAGRNSSPRLNDIDTTSTSANPTENDGENRRAVSTTTDCSRRDGTCAKGVNQTRKHSAPTPRRSRNKGCQLNGKENRKLRAQQSNDHHQTQDNCSSATERQ